MRRTGQSALQGYVVLFFIFMLLPILIVVAVSFTNASYMSFPIESFSLRWYRRVFEYKPFTSAFAVSLQVALVSAGLGCLIGVPAALALTRSKSAYAGALTIFLLSPLSMPLIVLGFAMLFYFSALGLGVSFTSLILAHTVVSLPYIIRTVAGVYRGISAEYEESALILGASRFQVFLHVTFPLIRPGVFAGAIFAMLISFDNLPLSYFFGSPSTNTLPVVVLSYLEYQIDPAIAAVSTLQMAVAVAGLWATQKIFGLRGFAP